jgi:hypothetical protein
MVKISQKKINAIQSIFNFQESKKIKNFFGKADIIIANNVFNHSDKPLDFLKGVYNLLKEGRFKEALAIYRWFMPLLHLDVSTKLVQNIKLAETMVGIGNENVRPPRLPLADEERQLVIEIIEKGLDSRPKLPELNG